MTPDERMRDVLIETERLSLRALTMADLEEFLALPHFSRPFDRQRAIERLEANAREWNDRGHGLFAVIDRHTGRFLGRVALKYWPQFDETEVGWVLRRDAWDHGYATEAASACVSWGFRNLRVPYLTAIIRPDNARSIRVAERLGVTPLRTDVLFDDPVVVYSISREDDCRRSSAAARGLRGRYRSSGSAAALLADRAREPG